MPKVIVNTCYIKSSNHFLNYLEYAGEKIEAQSITLKSGETIDTASDEIIKLDSTIEKINVTFKDGKVVSMEPERYQMFTNAKQLEYTTPDLIDTSGTVQKENMNTMKYIDYIAHRPSVEKIEGVGHGLFDMNGSVDISTAKKLAEQYEKNIKWSHIISLTRTDAERTGYDNRNAWENLIRAKAPAIAKAYNISLENLVLNCAFHNKDDHPHIHLFVYSRNNREAFITGGKEGLIKSTEKMKSIFFNEIFKDDVSYLKEIKNDQENVLEKKLKEITRQITNRMYIPPSELLTKLHDLSFELDKVKGNKYYGYLPQPIKQHVNDILQYAIQNDKFLNQTYAEYMKTYRTLIEQYIDDEDKINKKLDAVSEKLFNPGKADSKVMQNIIIKSALQYSQVIEKKAEKSPTKEKQKQGKFEAEGKNTNLEKAAEKYTGDNNFKELDNKDNPLLESFKKQLQKSLRCIYSDPNKDFSFTWQRKISDINTQLKAFEFQTFDKLSAHSRHDVLQIVKELLEKDDVLKQSYDKLIQGHKELFEQYDNSEQLLEGFKEYLFSEDQYKSSSIASSVIFFSCNDDVKFSEWRNLNECNKDVSKQLFESLNKCYKAPGENSTLLQEKIYKIEKLLEADKIDVSKLQSLQSELLHFLVNTDGRFALEYECLKRENKSVLQEHCYDVAQYEKKYLEELDRLFFLPGKYGYQKLHFLIERFSENSGSYKFNERLDHCNSYKAFNKELYKSLNKVFDYTSPFYSINIQKKLYNLHKIIIKLKDQKKLEESKDNDALKQSEISKDFHFRYSDLNNEAKHEIKDIILEVMANNSYLKALYNQTKAEYNEVVQSKLYYGEENIDSIMKDFDDRFFSPATYDTKSSHNILLKYAENFERNQIISEHYANSNYLRLQRKQKRLQAKQQQILQFAVKSMLYGLCKVFSDSAMNNNMYSQQNERNTTLKMGKRFTKKRLHQKHQNISNPIHF
ncbi:MobP3 family relaxase [Paludicola sp. MB14-C6]|uniref:MobP3 family relaxase n=1 Tax=Paludihabitans sp. MB14-C6 TaxID=3070656 RepID=UPI0027DB3EDB|nr:MobP3 family relaxase [Paludicola sp. MB14-C6]WMJ22686.1 MobP3 family relaxase [Paludicola sp. MB14-C6]